MDRYGGSGSGSGRVVRVHARHAPLGVKELRDRRVRRTRFGTLDAKGRAAAKYAEVDLETHWQARETRRGSDPQCGTRIGGQGVRTLSVLDAVDAGRSGLESDRVRDVHREQQQQERPARAALRPKTSAKTSIDG